MGPGAVIAKRFRLERQLGSGGMGAVWAATHLVTHKSVALKFLHEKHDDADARRRVLREARAACAVEHPNVVAVHDVVEDETGTPILVMDLLRGESLADKLARERTLSPAEAVAMISPVLSALSAAHAAGIIHRDLKPDNVFLVDGVSSNVKILDFGVAKLSGSDGATKETNRLTETGAMIGTPRYMAPEQAFGESDIDARADLWSVGAVLYECLAGVPPTDGQNLGQILKVLASGSIQPLAARAPAVPPALAAIVDGLLKIEKDERPASATIVLEQVAALADGALATPAAAAPASPQPRTETLALPAQPPLPTARARTLSLPAMTSTPPPVAAPPKRGAVTWIAAVATALTLASAAGVFGLRLHTPSAHASAPATSAPAPVVEPPAPAAPVTTAGAAPEPSAVAPEPVASVAAMPAKKSTKSAAPRPAAQRPLAPPAASTSSAKSSSGPLIVEPTF